MSIRHVLTTTALGAVATATLGVLPAQAATTYVVTHGQRCAAGTLEPTIQAAVNAASPGDTIKVCRGTYAEYVTVDKTLTILGAKSGVDGRNRTGSTQESIVDPDDTAPSGTPSINITASNVVLDGFLLQGNENGPAVQTSATESGYKIRNNRFVANAFGLHLNASGGTTTVVARNAFAVNNENLGAASAAGNGIYSDQGLSGALVQLNKFRNNINAAFLVGGAATGVTATQNISTADGTFFAAYTGGGFRILGNRVADANGSGVYFTGVSSATVQNNNIQRSGYSGIRIAAAVSSAFVQGNVTTGSGDQGISVSSEVPGAVTVQGNVANANNGDGILFSADTAGNVIRNNRALNNGNFDCQDLSSGSGTSGTANTWQNNVGRKSSPAGLCRRP